MIKRGLMMRVMIKKDWVPTSAYTLRRLLVKRDNDELILNVP